jgi:hypothetical protein
MALSSSNAVRQLSDGNSQGTVLGQSSADKIAFYGVTPIAKGTLVASSAVSTAVSSTNAFGFGDATTASTLVAGFIQLKQMGIL